MGASYGQSSGSNQSTSAPTDASPAELQGLRGPFADTLKGIFGSGGIGYNGPLVAPMTAGEGSGVSTMQNQATDPTRLALEQKTMSGGFLPGVGGGGNPFLQNAISDAQHTTLMGLQGALGRTIPSQFAAAGQQLGGQGSSAFERAKALQTGESAHALAGIATNMGMQGYENERGRQQGAISLSQNELQGLNTSLQASSLPRMIQDMGVQRGISEFNARVQSLLQALGMIASPVSQVGTASQSTGQTSSMQGSITGPKVVPT